MNHLIQIIPISEEREYRMGLARSESEKKLEHRKYKEEGFGFLLKEWALGAKTK